MTGEAASWNPSWEGWAIMDVVEIRGSLTHGSALTKQCNTLLVPHEESDRVVMWLT